MNAVQLAAVAGMLTGGGALLAWLGLRPNPPRLSGAFEQLPQPGSRPPHPPHQTGPNTPNGPTGQAGRRADSRLDRLLTRAPTLARRLPLLGAAWVDQRDLDITGTSRARFTLEKSLVSLAGLILPGLLLGVLALAGITTPWYVPAAAGPLTAALFWWSYDTDLRRKAGQRREEFLAALTAYLALVGLERQVRGSPIEALEEAARLSDSWPFRLLHTEVLRAELAGIPPWDGLRDLGRRLGITRLQSLADIVATAADGAAVFGTLMAEARSIRHEDLTRQRTAANVVSEHLWHPVSLLVMGYLLLMVTPGLLRLFLST